MLNRYWRPPLWLVALGLAFGPAPAHGDQSRVALEILNRTEPATTDRCDIAITARSLAPGETPLLQIDLRLSYDQTRLSLVDIAPGESVADSCALRFRLVAIDSIWPDHGSLAVVLYAPNPTLAPHLTDLATLDLVSLSFRRLDSGRADPGETDLTFCWLCPDDNMLRERDSDTLFASNHVYAPDSIDITCSVCPLPSQRGLPDTALAALFNGDTAAARALDFRSVRLQLDQPTGVEEPGETPPLLPARTVLHQNYPNPFNNTTVIAFDLPRSGRWRMTIINLLGRAVWHKSGCAARGQHRLIWDGCDSDNGPVAAGIYLYRLESGGGSDVRKLLLLK